MKVIVGLDTKPVESYLEKLLVMLMTYCVLKLISNLLLKVNVVSWPFCNF